MCIWLRSPISGRDIRPVLLDFQWYQRRIRPKNWNNLHESPLTKFFFFWLIIISQSISRNVQHGIYVHHFNCRITSVQWDLINKMNAKVEACVVIGDSVIISEENWNSEYGSSGKKMNLLNKKYEITLKLQDLRVLQTMNYI